jgi:UDP-glucose 4-epimerase
VYPFRRALVTGGASFIGSQIVDQLAKEITNCEIIVLEDLSTDSFSNLKKLSKASAQGG